MKIERQTSELIFTGNVSLNGGVTLHIPLITERNPLTPSQAREIAKAINDLADKAESVSDMGEADGSAGSPEELSNDYTGGSLNGSYVVIRDGRETKTVAAAP